MGGDICRLCLKESNLRNSHILPEFLYGKLYDDFHRMMFVSSDKKEKFIQKGLRESLLCQDCETKLSRFEGYARNLIHEIPTFGRHESGRFIYRGDVDYKQFKLFQLSLLWRSSISKEPMFYAVKLGRHEEILRKMLYEENPGSSSAYGCLMLTIPSPKMVDRIVWSPTREKLFGHNGYQFFTGNLFWDFFVTSHPVISDEYYFLQETGMLRIWIAPWNEDQLITNIRKAFKSRKW